VWLVRRAVIFAVLDVPNVKARMEVKYSVPCIILCDLVWKSTVFLLNKESLPRCILTILTRFGGITNSVTASYSCFLFTVS
jgi:hypothetical protein